MSKDQHPSRRTKQSNVPESETVAKWRSLLQGLKSESNLGNRNTMRQRLLKIRTEIIQIARNEARCLCNCEQITVAESWFWEEFETKMNVSCPIHGPCRLGEIVVFTGYPSDGDPRDRRLAELLREYDRRCVSYQNSEVEFDGP